MPEAAETSKGVIRVRGELHAPDNPSETMGAFSAEITPAAWKGKAARHLPGISCNRH